VKAWRTSSLLLLLAAIAVAGIGVYFIFLRPPLLPEDIRFLNLPNAALDNDGSRLLIWLKSVFTVLGGFAFATGILGITLATTAIRFGNRLAVAGAALAGAASIGLMAFVNFTIDSDFKWALAACALLWALGILAFLIEEGTATRTARSDATSSRFGRS
jgi:ABC-type cobalamin transport system permease subunit